MKRSVRLLLLIMRGSAVVTLGCFALVLPLFKLHLTSIEQGVAGMAIAFVPSGLAGWWTSRTLRSEYPPVAARAAGITFAVLAPVGLGIGLLLGQVIGGFAGALLGNPFSFLGFLVGIVATIVMMTLPAVHYVVRSRS